MQQIFAQESFMLPLSLSIWVHVGYDLTNTRRTVWSITDWPLTDHYMWLWIQNGDISLELDKNTNTPCVNTASGVLPATGLARWYNLGVTATESVTPGVSTHLEIVTLM
jgi:hypothetical protein